MSQRLEKYAPCLRQLYRSSTKNRKGSFKKLLKNTEFIKCLCECAKNIIKGNVRLTGKQREKVRQRKQSFRKLALKKTSLKEKRRIVQSGGFLGALLGPIISVISGLFGGGGGRKQINGAREKVNVGRAKTFSGVYERKNIEQIR